MNKEEKFQKLFVRLLARMKQYPGMAPHIPELKEALENVGIENLKEEQTIAPAEKLLLHCWKENPDTFDGTLIHPLSGEQFIGNTPKNKWEEAIISAMCRVIRKYRPASWEKLFFALWRFWQEECDKNYRLFPADDRLPGSSFFLQQDLESVMASIEEEEDTPAFLLFQLGPVQEFIACAKDTSDLLSGSYLIAYLTASAIKAVVDKVSPGCIVFPSLRGQGLYDLQNVEMLKSLSAWETLRQGESMRNPTLPNRFLALVPAKRAKSLAEAAETALRRTLQEIGDRCFESVCHDISTASIYRERWERQIECFPQITWQTLPFEPEYIDEANEVLEHFKTVAKQEFQQPLEQNIADWSLYFQKISHCLAARRNTRDFWQFNSGFRDKTDSAEDNHLSMLKDFLTGKEEIIGDEREWGSRGLGAMSLIKQRWFDCYLNANFGIEQKKIAGTEKIAKNNSQPNNYIAVLAMDGDHMGQWISGEKTPKFLDLLAPESHKFFESLWKKHNWSLEERMPVTPEYHLIFSAALAAFSNEETRKTVESFKGELIYAGGDDVLALLPASNAVACAEKLKERFTALCSEKGMWLPGPNATVSCGIAVGHKTFPLHNLITEAHNAEHRAKNGYNRNAIALSIFKRSGEILHWGVNFGSSGLPLLHAFEEVMTGEVVSGRFANALAALLTPYQLEKAGIGSDWNNDEARKILWAEFTHVCKQQSTVPGGTPESLKLSEAENYLDNLPVSHLADFRDLFLAEKFLFRGGAEEKEEE